MDNFMFQYATFISSMFSPYIIVPIFFICKIWGKPQYWENRSTSDFLLDIMSSIGLIISFFFPIQGTSISIEAHNSLYSFYLWGFEDNIRVDYFRLCAPLIGAILNIIIRLRVFSLITGLLSLIWIIDFTKLVNDFNGTCGIGLALMYISGGLLIASSFIQILLSPKKHLPFWMTFIAVFAIWPLTGLLVLPFANVIDSLIDRNYFLLAILSILATIIIIFLEYRFIFLPILKRDEQKDQNKASTKSTVTVKNMKSYDPSFVSEPTETTNSSSQNYCLPQENIPRKKKINCYDNQKSKENINVSLSITQEQVKRINKKSIVKNYNYKKLILFGSVSIVLVGILSGGYFLWYKPYSIERNAPRYYTFTNLNLRSSEDSESKDNIIEMIPYGTELITYGKGYSWARVKANGKEGHVAAYLILTKEDFQLLDGVWGNEDAKKCIGAAHYRLAVIDYLKRKEFSSGATEWQIFAKPYGGTLNTVSYPKFSQRKDGDGLIFIVKNNRTNERRLVVYGFTEEPKTPIYKTDISLEKDLSIRNVECRIEGYDILWIMITFNDGSYKIIKSTL